jgi:hypothetical protein
MNTSKLAIASEFVETNVPSTFQIYLEEKQNVSIVGKFMINIQLLKKPLQSSKRNILPFRDNRGYYHIWRTSVFHLFFIEAQQSQRLYTTSGRK